MVTIHSNVSLLWIVTIFLKQTLDGRQQGSQTSWKYALFLLVFVHYSLERERLIKDEPHLSILLPRQHAWPSTYWVAIISVGAFSITCYCIFTRFLCLMTAYWLPDDRLMTVWWLPDDCLMTAWWLPDDCLMTARWLPDDCLMTAWWLPDDCLMTAIWLQDECQMTAWWLSDDSLVNVWWMPDEYLITVWWHMFD